MSVTIQLPNRDNCMLTMVLHSMNTRRSKRPAALAALATTTTAAAATTAAATAKQPAALNKRLKRPR